MTTRSCNIDLILSRLCFKLIMAVSLNNTIISSSFQLSVLQIQQCVFSSMYQHDNAGNRQGRGNDLCFQQATTDIYCSTDILEFYSNSSHCVYYKLKYKQDMCIVKHSISMPYYVCIASNMCVLLFVLQMPDCWLEVSVRKVLRPANSTQVFLGFPVSTSES